MTTAYPCVARTREQDRRGDITVSPPGEPTDHPPSRMLERLPVAAGAGIARDPTPTRKPVRTSREN